MLIVLNQFIMKLRDQLGKVRVIQQEKLSLKIISSIVIAYQQPFVKDLYLKYISDMAILNKISAIPAIVINNISLLHILKQLLFIKV